MKIKILYNFLPPTLLICIIVTIWQYAVTFNFINSYILPRPTDIVSAFVQNWYTILINTQQTLLETLLGMIMAIFLGLLTAIFLDITTKGRKAVYPLLVISQTIPMIALAPILLIWLGFGIVPKIIIVLLSCFFPLAIATYDGISKTDPKLIHLLKSMGANYWQILWLVRFPGALPQFFSGLKIATTYSVTAAIVGEYVGSYQGLGIYMQEMANVHSVAILFAIIIVIALLTVLLFLTVKLIEVKGMPWYHKKITFSN